MTWLTRRRAVEDERGAVLIILTIVMSLLLLMVALVADLGNARQERRQAQATADAASLAGAGEMLTSGWTWNNVVTRVKDYARINWGVTTTKWVGCTDSASLSYQPDAAGACISADSSSVPTKLRVRVPTKAVEVGFAKIIGITSLNVSAGATASLVSAGECGLCVLSPDAEPALNGNGNAAITVVGAGVVVNSTASTAAELKGNATITATSIGGPRAPGGFTTTSNGDYIPNPTLRSPVPDPLSFLSMCPAAGASVCPTNNRSNVNLTGNDSQTIEPGIYNSIGASGNGTLTMNPGTYIIKDSFDFSGNGVIAGAGVTLYFACSSYPTPCTAGQEGASFDFTGNGAMNLSAPTTGPFKGLTVFFDRNNASTDAGYSGNGSGFGGTVYMKSAKLTLTGNGGLLGSRIVADTVDLGGNGALTINVTASLNVDIRRVALLT